MTDKHWTQCDIDADEAFRDALTHLLDGEVEIPASIKYLPFDSYVQEELMTLVGKGIAKRIGWATNTSIIECAEKLVEGAIENANIRPTGGV